MRLLVARQPLGRLLGWVRRVLFVGGVLLLAYCGIVMLDAWSFQRTARRQLEEFRSERQTATAVVSTAPAPWPAPANGTPIGEIDVPRLGISAVVIEGTRASNLRRAVGHITGTALPGQAGNVGISGHRDTFFRPLRNIRRNDLVTLTTLRGAYRYRVVSTKIVRPGSIEELDASAEETLTLVTCYPFYFVGPAPDRFIVRARAERRP